MLVAPLYPPAPQTGSPWRLGDSNSPCPVNTHPCFSDLEPSVAGWRLDHSYGRLPEQLFHKVAPTPGTTPRLVMLNRPLAEELGLDVVELGKPENSGWLTGNTLPPGAMPIAQAYAGHQFGNFTILGDGRAILLGEQVTPRGERVDIQLKGSGRTPFSRSGDGRAALGPMLREYIISEAMHGLGIPTTRSLAVALTGDPVFRGTAVPGAVLTRVAASHIRVGTFEWCAARKDTVALGELTNYTLARHYPELKEAPQPASALLQAVMERQAALIARWQMAGFIHGVMNTDNMALSGETIDYGPCAFMDAYHVDTVFSSIDRHGRYAYGKQSQIAHWNLACLASALLPALHTNETEALNIANGILADFPELFAAQWLSGMRSKLGIFNKETADETLANDLLSVMQEHGADFTNTFRDLASGAVSVAPFAAHPDFQAWRTRWEDRSLRQSESREDSRALMRSHNPAIIPRNHKVEEALEAAGKGDLSVMEKLLPLLTSPFGHQSITPEFSSPAPTDSGRYQTFCGT